MTKLELIARRYGPWLIVLALISYWFCAEVLIPAPFYAHYDPELPYLFSSLGPFKGQRYTYIDHPGTPVEILGTLLLVPAYLAASWQGQPFISFVLSQPAYFLEVGRAFLTLMSALCAVLLFRWAWVGRTWSDLAAALAVALVYFVVHPRSFLSLVFWSHNSFGFAFGTLLLLWLLVVVRASTPPSPKQLWLLGFCTGVLTAVQLYFATWVIGVGVTFVCLAILQRRRRQEVFRAGLTIGVTSLLGFVVATWPIQPYYRDFFAWVGQLIFHQGRYGEGEAGIASVSGLANSLLRLADHLPVLFLTTGALLATVVVLLAVRRRVLAQQPGLWAVAIGLSVQVVATLALIVKHPGDVYLLSVAAIIPVWLAVVLKLLDLSPRRGQALNFGVCLVVVAGFVFYYGKSVANQIDLQQSLAAIEADVQQQVAATAAAAHKPPEAVVVLWTYGVPSACYARLFGNAYAQLVFGPELAEICAGQHDFNIWDHRLFTSGGQIAPPDFQWDFMVVSATILDEASFAYLKDYGDNVTGAGGLVYIVPPKD